MVDTDGPQKTLIQQIHEELLGSIATLNTFDEGIIQKLRKLVEAGELKKPKRVTEVILPGKGGEHEAPGTGN